MDQTVSPITAINNKFPDAAYFTPEMIGVALGVKIHTVRYYCRRLFPSHDGYYRFFPEAGKHDLSFDDMLSVIRMIRQSKRQPKARKVA